MISVILPAVADEPAGKIANLLLEEREAVPQPVEDVPAAVIFAKFVLKLPGNVLDVVVDAPSATMAQASASNWPDEGEDASIAAELPKEKAPLFTPDIVFVKSINTGVEGVVIETCPITSPIHPHKPIQTIKRCTIFRCIKKSL